MSQPAQTTRDQRVKIALAGLVGWLVAAGVAVAVVGTYPTWRLAGAAGLKAELAAGLIVLGVKLASAVAVTGQAGGGPGRVAFVYVILIAVRTAAVLVLASGACWLWSLPPRALLIWTAAFYLAMLAAESFCLARALQRDAFRVALGEIDRPGRRSRVTTRCLPKRN